MKKGFRWDKKYLYWGVTAFCVVACAIVFYMALNYLPVLGAALKKLMGILSPFLWGLVISYLLLPGLRAIEHGAFGPLCARLYKNNGKSDGKRLAHAFITSRLSGSDVGKRGNGHAAVAGGNGKRRADDEADSLRPVTD